ncbi:MAG: hypothetical protein LBP59_17495, partial [Planctomycetaceae bacterium]|nr:hypothetical protein [Planctomycetaceae bacterium]
GGHSYSDAYNNESTTTIFDYDDNVTTNGFGQNYENVYPYIRYNNFTDNGAKNNYNKTTTTPNDVTNIEADNLENPFSQYTPSYLIAIDGPKLTNAVDEIPTFKGCEFFVVPELPDQSFTINTNLPSQPASGNTSGIRQMPKSVIGQIFEFGAIFFEEIGPAYSQNLDNIQTTLDVAGFTPIGVVTDPVNGGIHLSRGNYSESALSMVAAIPVIGDGIKAGATAAKTGKEIAEQAIKYGDEIVDAGKNTTKLTGQLHHPISKKIFNELDKNESISSKFKDNYRNFITKAIDRQSHSGYQQWHRELDDKIVDWLKNHNKTTDEEFIVFLKKIYNESDLAKRFPDFARDFVKWFNSLK